MNSEWTHSYIYIYPLSPKLPGGDLFLYVSIIGIEEEILKTMENRLGGHTFKKITQEYSSQIVKLLNALKHADGLLFLFYRNSYRVRAE